MGITTKMGVHWVHSPGDFVSITDQYHHQHSGFIHSLVGTTHCLVRTDSQKFFWKSLEDLTYLGEYVEYYHQDSNFKLSLSLKKPDPLRHRYKVSAPNE